MIFQFQCDGRESPNDTSSPTPLKAGDERNTSVELPTTSARNTEKAFGAATWLDCNFQDLESFIYSNWKCSNPLTSYTSENSFGKWGVTSEFLERSRQYLQTQTGVVPDVHGKPVPDSHS